MAEEAEVNTLVTLVSMGITFAKQRLEGFYKTCNAVSEFSNKVSTLNAKVELWNTLLGRFGPSEDDLMLPIVAAIEEARKCLEKEEDYLQQTRSTCCTRRCSRALFPDELTASFQKVIEAIDSVPLTKTPKEEAFEALEKARQRRTDSIATLRFSHDSKYVPISGSLFELQNALEAENGSQVVTLYGPPGMGKSMMVQHLALQYQEARQESKGVRDCIEISTVHFPDGVFYLDCGPDADSRAKHLELLQNLASRPEQIEIGSGREAEIQFDYDIHNRLCTRLSGQSVLIILDDVWNQEIIQQLLVPGKAVKYLVTTQKRGVWEDAFHVKIETPGLEDARAILASYVGGQPPSGEVESQIEALAEDVIKASDFNPLVLANCGLALKGERSTDPAEWRAAKEELFDVDGDEEDTFSGPIGFGKLLYPRTAATSTVMAIDVLPSEAQSLLLLATLCSGPSVPEQVLKLFFESTHGSRRRTYQKWSNHLEDRSLIQIQTHPVPWRSMPIRTWSVNRLRQYFIRRVKKESVSFLVQSLLGENSHAADSDLVVTLSAIYGVEELRAGASKRIGVDIKQNVTLWRCVEPFIWLLEVESGEAWEQQSLQSAKEVILQYIRKGRLAQNDLLHLLLQPQTSAATCWAIELMAWNWSTLSLWGALSVNPQKNLFRWTLKNKGAIFVFKGVLNLLRKDVDSFTQRMAANALVAFAWASHDITLPAASAALRELVTLLASDASAIAQEAGARALGRLAHLKGCNSQDINTVGEFPGVIEGLVRLLHQDVNLSVQTAAAGALYFLAGDRGSAGKLLGTRGALQKMADLLGKDIHPDVQQFAVLTLYNLSCYKEIVLANQMKGAFVYLQDIDSTTSITSIQGSPLKRPAEVLQNNVIIAFPGMLRGLVGLLQGEVKPVVQMLAASTLKRLAEVEVNRLGIAKFPGALEGLTRMLYSRDLDSLGVDMIAQAEAAETLGVLAQVDLNIKQVPGVVEGLKGLLAQDVHSYVQGCAARCLTIIDPIRANHVTLHSAVAYRARAGANIHMGLFHQALTDLEMFEELDPGSRDAYHELRFVKAMLGDYHEALTIADKAIQQQPGAHFDWAERGVLKRLMGDDKGALADLDRALDLGGDVHEYFKQRGYVKYLMGYEQGARLDAKMSMDCNANPADAQSRTHLDAKFSLSELSVAFLGYAL